MKIVTLLENTTDSDDLKCDHGLSFYIESANHMILCDMGPNEFFYDNARRLGVPLEMVDLAVLSHGHYDHGGGIPVFFEHNEKASLYAQRTAFDAYFGKEEDENTRNVSYEYIGIQPKYRRNSRVVVLDGDYRIDEEVELFTGVSKEKYVSPSNATLLRKIGNDCYEPDDFSHEQNLVVKNPDGTAVLFSGCCHSGIVNVMEEAYRRFGDSLKGVFAGFHLMNPASGQEPDEDFVCSVAEELKKYPVTYYTGHCTGRAAYEQLKKLMGEQIVYAQTGFEIEI